jgi:hypothetical protein
MALKVYERHLGREIYGATLLVLAAFLALFAFFDLITELEDVGKEGYELRHALAYVALTLPGRVYEILPITVLIGSLYALTLLARHSEITVLRTAGLPTGDLLLTLGKIGSVFVLCGWRVHCADGRAHGTAVAANRPESHGGQGIPFRTMGEGWSLIHQRARCPAGRQPARGAGVHFR